MVQGSRVVIVNQQSSLRALDEKAVRASSQLTFINSYPNWQLAAAHLLSDHPDILVFDLAVSPAGGIKGIAHLRRIAPTVRFLIVAHSSFITSKSIVELFSAGAFGIINRDVPDFDLTSALRLIYQGGAPMSISVATVLVTSFHRNPHSPLTNRESEIMSALGGGKSYDSIAQDLSISVETVKTHIRHIYYKLQVNKKSDAIQKARSKNFI